jgi:cytochrome c oxidase assembly protein subunit 11
MRLNALARAANSALSRRLVVVTLLMFGFGWALVPLYRKICEVTGINVVTGRDPGAAEQARNTQVDASRTVVVEFDTNLQGPWRFKPAVRSLAVHPGELVHINYELVNLENHALVGQAIPSYAPQQAAAYFRKIECFCFQQQKLAAGQTKIFPVVFFIDPALPTTLQQITLSYTFFAVAGAAGST